MKKLDALRRDGAQVHATRSAGTGGALRRRGAAR
jgi:hypothetical protein